MKWVLYILLTIIVYFVSWIKLRFQTEKDRIRVTPLFLSAISFFIVFEYIFIESIIRNFLFHVLGFVLSILYSISIYILLKRRKRRLDLIFDKMVKENQGKISVLSFIQATQLSQEEVELFLSSKLQELKGYRTKTIGNIYYDYSRWQ